MARAAGKPGIARATTTTLVATLVAALGMLAAPSAQAAPGWLAPTDLSASGRDGLEPVIGMDDSGGTVSLWWNNKGSTPFNAPVQASLRAPGEAFGSPVDLSAPAQKPVLGTAGNGESVAAWWHYEAGLYVLEAARKAAGASGFAASEPLEEISAAGSPPKLHLGINASGDAALAFTLAEAEESVVLAATLRADGSFSGFWEVSDEGDYAASPEVAVNPAGEAVVVWSDHDETLKDPGVIELSRGFGPGFTSPLELSTTSTASEPQVAVESNGDPTVVWAGREEVEEEEEGEVVTVALPPAVEGCTVVAASCSPLSLSGEPDVGAFGPRLAVGGGLAAVAWLQGSNPSEQVLRAAVRPPGSGFGAPIELGQEGTVPQHPDLAVNGEGRTVLVWQGDSPAIVRAAIRPPGGSFSAPVDLSEAGGDALFPRVAMDASGDAVVVWSRSNGTDKIVQAAGYDANPPGLRNLAVPSTGTVGVPVGFSVESFDVWPTTTGFDFGDGTTAPGAAVSHVYGAPGVYQVTATAADPVGSSVSATGAITILASDEFRLGKLRRNKRKGRATLEVHVSGPGLLTLFGKGLKKVTRRAAGAGVVRLPVKPSRRSLKKLRRGRHVKALAKVTFSPTGGTPSTQRRRVTLVMRSGKHRRHARHHHRH